MAALRANVWPQRAITCLFLDGPKPLQAMVKYYASQWERYGALSLCWVRREPADVRITFKEEGSWSYIGTDALSIPQDEPTMCYGWLEDSFRENDRAEIRRVTLHEFGHASGLIHEHLSPKINIRWNRDAVYAYYQGPPNHWSKADVDANLFSVYAATQTNASEYDPDSIMHYPIPKEFVLDPAQAVGWNDRLSSTDKRFFGVLYPRSGAPPQGAAAFALPAQEGG
jgi:hypothetical protein